VIPRNLIDVFRAFRDQWWRYVLLQTLVLLGLSAAIGVAAWLIQGNGAGLTAYITADPGQVESRVVGVASIAIAAIALVSIPFLVAGAAATAQVTDAALADGTPRLWRSLRRGFARVLPILGTICLASALVVAFLVATPFISFGGVLGLAVTGVIALIRRRKPGIVPKWPGWRTWGFAAIPFGWFGRVAARAVLMLPAAVLEPAGPLRAHRAAERAAAGRRLSILAVTAIAFAATIGLSAGFAMLGSALWGDVGASLFGGIVQLIALPLPIVAAVAMYRRAAGPSGRVFERASSPAPARSVRSASPVMSRIAVVIVAALVATMGVATASPASADPANAGKTVSFVVTSGVDTLDAGELEAQQASCLAAGLDCTIRAALALAAEDAADGALSAAIGFSADMTITLAGTLAFAPTAASAIVAGVLSINGNGHDIVLDGGYSYQILKATSEYWNLSVSGVTFRHGYSDNASGSGGALNAGVPQTQLQSVLFDGNSAFSGGGAVFARALTVLDSTFLDSRVTYWSATLSGGAIRATGQVAIVNSTFSGSGIGDDFTPVLNNGSDVDTDAGMTVVNSTFVNSRGGSLRADASSEIRNSLFTTDWTRGGLACNGPFTGGTNVAREGDTTCPGTAGTRVSSTVVLALDSTGIVPVFPLNPSGNPALGAGVNCPAKDALGTVRAASGCDLGAVEFSGLTTLALAAVPSTTVAGSVTVKATVTSDTSAVPQGSVTFTFNGVVHDPVTLNNSGDPGTSVAEQGITDLTVGQTYSYSAVFTPSGPFVTSSAGPLSYTVQPVQVPVDLQCASPDEPNPVMAPECVGQYWNIAETESIHLVAKVVDAQAGTVRIALDPAGTNVVAGPEAVVNGEAAFVIPASAFGLGLHDTLHAIYQSDDGTLSGVSPLARSLLVLHTPTVAISGVGTTGVYGDTGAGTFTVTVSGADATPTGTITVFGREATLNASGQATVDLSDLGVSGGVFDLAAKYEGDAVYGRGTSNTVHYQTTAAATTTQITTISPDAPQFGQPVTVTVMVRSLAPSGADPQGSVTIVADGTETLGIQRFGPVYLDPSTLDGDGEYTFEVDIPAAALGAGDHSLVAEFDGNDNFVDSSSTASPFAFSISRAPTSTVLAVTPAPSVWGDQVILTATVDAAGAASLPTGTVAFSDGDATLGTATLTACGAPNPDGCSVASITVAASAIGIGTTALTAAYQGTDDFEPSGQTVEDYVVSKAAPTVQVTGAASLSYGTSTSYIVTVGTTLAKPVDGTQVVVTAVPIDSDPISLGTVTLTDGSGTIAVPTLGTLVPGSYAITASFAGDASFEPAMGSAPLAVNKNVTDIGLDSISGTTVVYGRTLDVVLTVKNTSSGLEPEGDVVVTWFGHEVGRATLTPDDNTGAAGVRTVHITATFGAPIVQPDEFWLAAEFVPAVGFAGSQLGADANDRVKVTIAPLQTEVAVDAIAVLGQPLAAVATVGIVGDDAGITPGGWINFTIVKSGAGSQEVGPVALVDGQASLAQALGISPQIMVNLAGSWVVRATYIKDYDSRYVAVSPNNTAVKQVDIVAGGASVTADAPETAELYAPVNLHVNVDGAVTPSGTVSVRPAGSLNELASQEVTLIDGQADITVLPGYLGLGSKQFVVNYSGNGTLSSANSAPFTIVVGPTGTTTTVDTTSRGTQLYPGIVGAKVQYTAHVTATGVNPAGNVEFRRGSTFLGLQSVDTSGNASISITADQVWSGDIVATFKPALTSMRGSEATLAHSWIQAPVTVTLQAPASNAVGTAAKYTVRVQFDWTDHRFQFQYLEQALLPSHGPSGAVTIRDGDGTSCTAFLIESSAQLSTATCDIQFGSLGAHEFTASYSGYGSFAGGSSTAMTTTVSRGTPVLTLSTPNQNWLGLTTIPVDWSVAGPADGTVTIKRGADVVCTSASLVGSCDVAIPAYNDIQDGDRLTLEYSGSPLWNSKTTSKSGTIVACVPFEGSSTYPAGSATVSVYPAPTCGGGTGYYTSDTVRVSATAQDGYRLTGFSGGSAGGTQLRFGYPASDVTLWGNGTASMSVSPVVQWWGSQQIPFGIQANTTAACIPVRINTTGISNRSDAVNALFWDSTGKCDGTVTLGSDNTTTAYFLNGAKVRVNYQSGFVPAGRTFYGWQGLASGDPFAEQATYTISPTTTTINALFGPVCYATSPNVVQPSDGTITVSLPSPNCSDPRTGVTGWTLGTRGSATLVDTTGSTFHVVSSRYGSLNGYMQLIEDKAWAPERPIYFDGWSGDTGSWTARPTTIGVDAAGVRKETRTVDFQIGEHPITIGAAYASCSILKTQVNGDTSSGVPGTVTVNTAPNCPLGAGYDGERWYKTGTQVSLTTKATGEKLRLLGWSGIPLPRAKLLDTTVSFALDADATATVSYGTNANCRPLTVSTVPAGALTLSTSFTLGSNACAAMYGDRFYDQGTGGNGVNIDATPATAEANGAEVVFAWASNAPNSASGTVDGISTVWKRSPSLSEFFYGNSTVVAYACEFVAIDANVYSPDGALVSNAGAENISRESQSKLGDFVITQPADCSTGADPRSGYGGYAWLVGTQLVPVVTADPVAYKFTGWSGDVKGTGQTTDAPLSLVGPGRTAQGDNYHYRVTANFSAICYTLSLPSDADKLEVITAPNCPGVDVSRRMYLGGTAVVVHAPDKGDVLFRNWVSGTDVIDADTHWASVVMTSDKSVVPYYSTKSVGEQITTYGTMVGDQMAIASKKMIGVAAAAVSAYVKTLLSKATLVASGIGYIAQGLEYFGVEGAVIDGMKSASTAMNDMLSMLFAPLDCITAWSAGGENTAFYAAQNLIGSAIVEGFSSSAQKPQAPTSAETTLQKLQAQAGAAKTLAAPAASAASAIDSAKSIYDAAASGNIGWESSAYDAWASQNSVSVYTTCMANKMGGAAMSIAGMGG
jgi:predicted outer membrane repeat protein